MPTTSRVTAYQTALDNAVTYADYREVADADRARKFITAVERLLMLVPDSSERTGQSLRFDKRVWQDRLLAAQAYVASVSTSATDPVAYYRTGAPRYQ